MENKETKVDSGLRGKFNGELYVENKVFFNRTDVKNLITSLKNSEVIREHIRQNNKNLRIAE